MKVVHSHDKQVLLRAFALLYQAERTLMCVLWPTAENWKAFRNFYSSERRSDLVELAGHFPNQVDFSYSKADAIARRHPRYPILNVFRAITNRWGNRFWLSPDIRDLIGFVLNRMLFILQSPQQPDAEQMIDFRLVTTTALSLLGERLVGLRELELIRRQIEHLGRSSFMPLPSLSYREFFPSAREVRYRQAV